MRPRLKDPPRVTPVGFALALMLAASVAGAEPRPLVDLGGPGAVRGLGVGGGYARDLAVANRVLVRVHPAVRSGLELVRSAGFPKAQITRSVARGRLLVVDLPAGSDVLAAAAQMATAAGVLSAGPDRVVRLLAIPGDPEYRAQWHLAKIHCPEAWDLGTGSGSVVVAIVDSGIDMTHPDLESKIWTNGDEIPGNGIDDDRNGYVDDARGWNFWDDDNNPQAVPDGIDQNHDGDPDEQVNHGTLCAGLVGAAANDWGTVGVSWNTTIMPLKVFPDDGTSYVSTVVEAMYYAAENGAHIMNLSLGAPYDAAFTDPIVEMYNNGGLTVCAAGNDGSELRDARSSWSSPACNNGPNPLVDNMVLGVGGLNSLDQRASWSNYDGSTRKNFVEVFAPGVNIHGCAVHYPSVSGFSSWFTTNSGTSFSSPIAAGLAALLKAQDPSRTPAQLIAVIRSTCDNVDAQNPAYVGKLGAGRINAARAMGVALPPAAPTSVAAGDTPGDQGGSITVTWVKSVDDGGGSGKVTGYVVERAEGALPTGGAGWTEVATPAAGAAEHVDATTTDGTDYYYRVSATDGTLRGVAGPVGPAQSFDDSAPPRVTDLVALDHPLDLGGAIDLSWAGYTGSADLAEFRVYRDTREFTTVVGKTPLVVLADPAARAYTDTPTSDGVDYYYAVTTADALGNERKDVMAAGPVQSYANGPVTLPAGLQMLASPIIPTDHHPATLLGVEKSGLRYARYDAAAGEYVLYGGEPLGETLELGFGRGFWVYLDDAVTVSPVGATAPGGPYDLPVTAAWQLLGNPFFGPIDFGASSVTVGAETMDLASADAMGIMKSYAWVYNAATGDYDLIHGQFGVSRYIQPWQAFWALVQQPCTLSVAPVVAASAAATRGRAKAMGAGQGEWPIRIVARSAGGLDAANYCGVCTAPSWIASPPSATERAELGFVKGGSAGGAYATAFEATAGRQMRWEFQVAWQRPQGSVTVSWPDLSRVPKEYSLTLRDLDTGTAVSMRHQTSYAVDATATTGVRRLAVEAVRGATSGVQITAAAAAPTPAGGAQIAFSLSATATCDATIMNIAGRVVRTVATGQVCTAGANVMLWDGRGSSGTRVPSGTYLVRVTARGDDGTLTSALRNLRVER